MDTLFRIETDKVILKWSIVKQKELVPLSNPTPIPGRLKITGRRHNLTFGKIYRSEPISAKDSGVEINVGPRLYEETDYKLYARAKEGNKLTILHRDPTITRSFDIEDDGKTLYGVINFRSQIGIAEFSVILDGQSEFDFQVEVFPSKLDYATDYAQLLAEVQDTLTGLALEYLRSTFQLGQQIKTPNPTHLEWLLLLRHVVEDLEQALQYINQQPIRGLTRDPVIVRSDKIKKIDAFVRSAARRGSGSGGLIPLRENTSIKEKVISQQARQTLDTPEHRWLARQLLRLQQRISRVRREEALHLQNTPKHKQVFNELDQLESRITRLLKLKIFEGVSSELPIPNFSSLQLLSASGYREAYRCCLILSMGLRIEGGPIRLSVKDLSLLYEYWCFLAVLRLISEELQCDIPVNKLFAIQQQGLKVLIEKGRQKSIRFSAANQRKITVSYNPRFHGQSILIPQQPDLVITLDDPQWHRLHLVLDAKYRIDASTKYVERYHSPGPPEDAVNIMHRYRDAILESESSSLNIDRPKRTVVEAAAIFPYREKETDEFKDSLLWKSLDKIGVGALPALPGDTEYLREWLNTFLRQGGWALADRAIDHRGRARLRDWRIAASEAVLIGVLRSANQDQHLKWVLDNNRYYMPLLKTQKRQFAAKWLALYISKSSGPGSVAYLAPIQGMEIIKRKDIYTPWATGNGDKLQVLYQLGQVEKLPKSIVNQDYEGRAQRFSSHRWTSRLALQRAEIISELLIETEPEWRLYEDLMAMDIRFKLVPDKVLMQNPDIPFGRVWFLLEDGVKIRYAGASGYIIKRNSLEKCFMRLVEVLGYVKNGLS